MKSPELPVRGHPRTPWNRSHTTQLCCIAQKPYCGNVFKRITPKHLSYYTELLKYPQSLVVAEFSLFFMKNGTPPYGASPLAMAFG